MNYRNKLFSILSIFLFGNSFGAQETPDQPESNQEIVTRRVLDLDMVDTFSQETFRALFDLYKECNLPLIIVETKSDESGINNQFYEYYAYCKYCNPTGIQNNGPQVDPNTRQPVLSTNLYLVSQVGDSLQAAPVSINDLRNKFKDLIAANFYVWHVQFKNSITAIFGNVSDQDVLIGFVGIHNFWHGKFSIDSTNYLITGLNAAEHGSAIEAKYKCFLGILKFKQDKFKEIKQTYDYLSDALKSEKLDPFESALAKAYLGKIISTGRHDKELKKEHIEAAIKLLREALVDLQLCNPVQYYPQDIISKEINSVKYWLARTLVYSEFCYESAEATLLFNSLDNPDYHETLSAEYWRFNLAKNYDEKYKIWEGVITALSHRGAQYVKDVDFFNSLMIQYCLSKDYVDIALDILRKYSTHTHLLFNRYRETFYGDSCEAYPLIVCEPTCIRDDSFLCPLLSAKIYYKTLISHNIVEILLIGDDINGAELREIDPVAYGSNLLWLGKILIRLGRFEKAKSYFERSLTIDEYVQSKNDEQEEDGPMYSVIYLGVVKFCLGQFKDAESTLLDLQNKLNQIEAFNKTKAAVNFWLGKIYFELNELDKSEECFTSSLPELDYEKRVGAQESLHKIRSAKSEINIQNVQQVLVQQQTLLSQLMVAMRSEEHTSELQSQSNIVC